MQQGDYTESASNGDPQPLPRQITEISGLSLSEKLQMMEALWEDLRSRAVQVPMPEWHKDLLDARRNAVSAGQEKILDGDERGEQETERRVARRLRHCARTEE